MENGVYKKKKLDPSITEITRKFLDSNKIYKSLF